MTGHEGDMGETAANYDDMIKASGFRPPELSLVATEAPHGAFFNLEDNKEPDLGRLRRTAEEPFSMDTVCVELIEEMGLVDPPAIIEEFKRQADALALKPGLSESDETMLLHLASHIDRRTELQKSVAQSARLYEKAYWEDFVRRTGLHHEEIDSDLYLNPVLDDGDIPPALEHIITLRKQSGNSREAQKNLMDAERIIRMLVINERTNGQFFDNLETLVQDK